MQYYEKKPFNQQIKIFFVLFLKSISSYPLSICLPPPSWLKNVIVKDYFVFEGHFCLFILNFVPKYTQT